MVYRERFERLATLWRDATVDEIASRRFPGGRPRGRRGFSSPPCLLRGDFLRRDAAARLLGFRCRDTD